MRSSGSCVTLHRTHGALIVALVTVAALSCECKQSNSRENSSEILQRQVSGLPEPHSGESLTARERQHVASLKAVLGRYYPTWERVDETVDDYLARYENSPERGRLKALVKDRVRDDGDWQRFLRDVERNMPEDVLVRDGRPPFGVIPSYQLVIQATRPRGLVALVWRFSYLAPVYDYYESTRDQNNLLVETRLAPSAETASLVNQVRGLIGKHYGDYRELPISVSTTLMPDMGTGNLSPGEATLADALFEDSRSW